LVLQIGKKILLLQDWNKVGNEAISVLKNTKENPQAIRLYEELSEHLKMCVRIGNKKPGEFKILGCGQLLDK
jgi:hypothetical protein